MPLFKANLVALVNSPTPDIIYHLKKLTASCLRHLSTGLSQKENYLCKMLRLTKHGNKTISINCFHVILWVLGYVVLGATLGKKTNIVAWVLSWILFMKYHKSDDTSEIFLLKIKAVFVSSGSQSFSSRGIFGLWNQKIGPHFAIMICLMWTLANL